MPDFETCHISFKVASSQKENNGLKMNDEDHRRLAFGKRVTREPSVKDSPETTYITCYFLGIKVKVGEVDFKHTLADYRNHRLLFQIQFPRLGFVFPVVELMGSC